MNAPEPQIEEIEARRSSAPAVLFAILSRGASLISIVSFVGFFVLLCINWKVSLIAIPLGIGSVFFARYFNRKKLCAIYGPEFGRILDDVEWETGKKVQF